MRWIVVSLVLVSTMAEAESYSYVCLRGKTREFSTIPCEESGAVTINKIATNPTPNPPPPPSDVYTQLENIRKNRRELAARHAAERPAAPATPRVDNTRACEDNWKAIEQVNSMARVNSSDYLNQRKRELQDARWKLGC